MNLRIPNNDNSNLTSTISIPLSDFNKLNNSKTTLTLPHEIITALKGFTEPRTIQRLEKIWKRIEELEKNNMDEDYSFLRNKYNYILHHKDNLHERLTNLEVLIELCKRYPNKKVIERVTAVDSKLELLTTSPNGSKWHTKIYDASTYYLKEPHDIVKFYGTILEIQNDMNNEQKSKSPSLLKKLSRKLIK